MLKADFMQTLAEKWLLNGRRVFGRSVAVSVDMGLKPLMLAVLVELSIASGVEASVAGGEGKEGLLSSVLQEHDAVGGERNEELIIPTKPGFEAVEVAGPDDLRSQCFLVKMGRSAKAQ
jgi:hypothetical protein